MAEWVERGPDLERDGVVRWRCVDLQQGLTDRHRRNGPQPRLSAAVSAQTPVQSRALERGLAQGLAHEPAQPRCERCGAACPEPIVTVIPNNGDPSRFWCSLDHAVEDGWPWLKSEPAPPPKQRKRRCSQ